MFATRFRAILVSLGGIATLVGCIDNRRDAPQSPEPPTIWQPQLGTNFDIRNAPLDTDDIEETALGSFALFVDAWTTSDATVAALQGKGYVVVATMAVGTVAEDTPDFTSIPSHLVGELHPGGDGRRWLDVRARGVLVPLIAARFDLLKSKGFDAIAPLDMDGYAHSQGELGFEDAIAPADVALFMRALALEAHARNLSIGQVNAPALAPEMQWDFDWALTENAFVEDWAAQMEPYLQRNLAVFGIEYAEQTVEQQFFSVTCDKASQLHVSAVLKNRSLDAYVRRCLQLVR